MRRTVQKHTGRGKLRAQAKKLPAPGLRLCGGALIYLVLLVSCLIFTQALRSSVSAVTYAFVICIPAVDAILLFISARHVRVEPLSPEITLEKHRTAAVSLSVTNTGIIPVSCAEFDISLPDAFSAGCVTGRKCVTLPPFSVSDAGIPVKFDFMGKYTVGTDSVRIYSLFRIFRTERRVRASVTVSVLPDRLPPCGPAPVSESSETNERILSGTRSESGDIRQYLPGDSIKTVHWKLSTKTDELQVRKYVSDSGRAVTVFCDFGGGCPEHFPEYARAFSADRIAAEALAAVRESAALGKGGQLVINREDAQSLGFAVPADADRLAAEICGVNASSCTPGVTGMPASAFGSSLLFVTSFIPDKTAAYITDAAALLGAGRVSVCVCDLSALYSGDDREKYRLALDGFCRRTRASGIKVTVPDRKTEECDEKE